MSTLAADTDVDLAPHEDLASAPRLAAVVAEFAHADQLLHASEIVRDAGYTRWDTHTPFPVHHIDVAMGVKATILPWIVLGGGLTGAATGLAMQYYMNGAAWAEKLLEWPFAGYPYLISGKPLFSLPANIPITFELTILLSAFAAFFGMIALNRLFFLYNPLHTLDRFLKVTNDKFFLSIDSADPKFNLEQTTAMLRSVGPIEVEEVWDSASRKLPSGLGTIGLVLFAVALLPPLFILSWRSKSYDQERIHPITDMDYQAKFKAQQRNTFFADGRAMRPNVPGTVPRDSVLDGASEYLLGVQLGQALASVQDPDTEGGQPTGGQTQQSADVPPPPAAGMNENQNWVETIPVQVTPELLARGHQRYNIYCAPCHGLAGEGNGLVNQRATSLKQPTWLPAPSLHTRTTNNRADGYIYRAIKDGVRKMPAYGSQIPPADRWAIVAYVRALQTAHGVEPDAAPPGAK